MGISGGVIHASTINGNGGGERLTGDEISKLIRDDTLVWVHLDGTDPASHAWLEKELTHLDEIIVDALLAEETRPRSHVRDTHVGDVGGSGETGIEQATHLRCLAKDNPHRQRTAADGLIGRILTEGPEAGVNHCPEHACHSNSC